jgi:hypothetical protein
MPFGWIERGRGRIVDCRGHGYLDAPRRLVATKLSALLVQVVTLRVAKVSHTMVAGPRNQHDRPPSIGLA